MNNRGNTIRNSIQYQVGKHKVGKLKVGKHKHNPIGNSIGNSIGNAIGNTIGNSIGNTIKRNPNFPDTPFYKYFDFFIIVFEKGLMPY